MTDYDVFVVHASDDTPFVKGELLPLLNLSDDRVILSSELPLPGFTEQLIADAVEGSRLTLAVVSPAYLRDRWAGFAELLSRNAHAKGDGGTLVPLRIVDCEVPLVLAQHHVLDGRTSSEREACATRLRNRLGRPAPKADRIPCPYPGMQPFSAATTSRFHGRKTEIDDLLGRLRAGERNIFVIGPSGSGKSSLVAAGVLPLLEAPDARIAGARVVVRSVRPGERPLKRLADAIGCREDELPIGIERLVQPAGRLVLFIDQFEEVFALADDVARAGFLRALAGLRDGPSCQLVVGLRADFYGALMSSELWPELNGRFSRIDVAPLRGAALRQAIEEPARDVGVYLESALVERLVTDSAAEPGALPLLQEALVLLWEQPCYRLLKLESYDALGSGGRAGLAVALARRANAVLHDMTTRQQTLARRIFLRLVSFGEGRPDTRRQQPRASLADTPEDDADVQPVIDRLIEGRLVTSDATQRGEPLIDLSHEALIAGWPELQRWIRLRRDDEGRRRRLEQHAAEWVERGRGSVGLFDPVELGEAERWMSMETARELGHSDDVRQFLSASHDAVASAETKIKEYERRQRAAEEERAGLKRRASRVAIGFLAILSCVASLLSFIAWSQRSEARRQTSDARLRLGLNEQEQGRRLLLELHDPSAAVPHLAEAVRLGVDSDALQILLTNVDRTLWSVSVRHPGPIYVAAFSPDGTRVVTTAINTARISDAITGAQVGTPIVHAGLHDAAFSPDGLRLLTAGDDGTARVWDARTGKSIGMPLEHKSVQRVGFSPDGAFAATGGIDGVVQLWDPVTGARAVALRHGAEIRTMAFSLDGTRVVTTGSDNVARVWNTRTGNAVGVPMRHDQPLRRAVFSPDGSRVVTASEDQTARIWNAETGEPLSDPLKHDDAVNDAVFSSDGTRVVTASLDRTVRLWDASDGRVIAVMNHEGPVWGAAFSPDGMAIVSASFDGTARLWDGRTGNTIGVLEHEGEVMVAAFSPDSARVLTASRDGMARIWDASTGAPTSMWLGHDDTVWSVAFSPDGARVATASAGRLRIWDTTTGNLVGDPLKHDGLLESVSFSPDGSRVLGVGERSASIWNPATGTIVGGPLKHDGRMSSAAFSPDSRRVVTAGSDSVRLWDATNGAPLAPVLHAGAETVAFSSSGALVLTASTDGNARIWNPASDTIITLKHDGPLRNASFSPDDSRVVTAAQDGTVRLWDARTGQRIGAVMKHDLVVWRAVFSTDGRRIVTASEDRTVRLWDAATGAPIGVPLKHDGPVRALEFTSDGSCIVTTSTTAARLWDSTSGAPLGGPLKHPGAQRVAISPDGTRIVTGGDDGARIWNIVDVGTAQWANRVRGCFTAGETVQCDLADREITREGRLLRSHSLLIEGDLAAFSRAWALARGRYEQAMPSPDDLHPDPVVNKAAGRRLSVRMAVIDALAGSLAQARSRVGGDAPPTDAVLLAGLGSVAHEDMSNDAAALELQSRAHDADPKDLHILADLAETYFVTGRYDEMGRAVRILQTSNPSDEEVVVFATLVWATAHLTRVPEKEEAASLVAAYAKLPLGTQLRWSWKGTRHALAYGRYRSNDVRPILEVLELLERPITAQDRALLAEFAQGHLAARTGTK